MTLRSIFAWPRTAFIIWPITSWSYKLRGEAATTNTLFSSIYHLAVHHTARYTQGEHLQRFGFKAFSQERR